MDSIHESGRVATANDLMIEELADSECELLERVAELERENAWQAETIRVAVDLLHTVNVEHDRAKATIIRLRQELRDMRGASSLAA